MTAFASTFAPHERANEILWRVAGQRSCVYRWLATGFYAPNESLVEALQNGQMKRELFDATLWLGKDQQPFFAPLQALDSLTSADLGALRDSFDALFGKSVNRVAAHEAAYFWRSVSHPVRVEEDVNRALVNLYGQYGLKPQPGMEEDSLPMELEFMAYLCQTESREWGASAPKSARELRRQERAFLTDHLGRWMPEFCQRVEENGSHSFYSVLSTLAHAWIKIEYASGYASS